MRLLARAARPLRCKHHWKPNRKPIERRGKAPAFVVREVPEILFGKAPPVGNGQIGALTAIEKLFAAEAQRQSGRPRRRGAVSAGAGKNSSEQGRQETKALKQRTQAPSFRYAMPLRSLVPFCGQPGRNGTSRFTAGSDLCGRNGRSAAGHSGRECCGETGGIIPPGHRGTGAPEKGKRSQGLPCGLVRIAVAWRKVPGSFCKGIAAEPRGSTVAALSNRIPFVQGGASRRSQFRRICSPPRLAARRGKMVQ